MHLGQFSDGQSVTVGNQTNIRATKDTNWCGEDPQHGVWYKLSIDVPAEVTVNTCDGINFATLIAVYSGSCEHLMCADYIRVGCQKTSRIEHPGYQEIYILVGGYEGATGNFNLTVSVSSILVGDMLLYNCVWKDDVY